MAPDEPPVLPVAREGKPCAICGKPVDEPYAPFCSKRCADVDLHRWLHGVYAVPAPPAAEDLDEET